MLIYNPLPKISELRTFFKHCSRRAYTFCRVGTGKHPAAHHACFTCSTRSVEQVFREGADAPSPRGFSSLVRSNTFGKDKKLMASRYTFEAPGVIRVRAEGKKAGESSFGAALHCIPIGKGRSRLLFKASWVPCVCGACSTAERNVALSWITFKCGAVSSGAPFVGLKVVTAVLFRFGTIPETWRIISFVMFSNF